MPTYTPLQSITLTSSAATVVISNIPQTYQDLYVVVKAFYTTSASRFIAMQYNADTGNNYSNTYLLGNGTSVVTATIGNSSSARIGNASNSNILSSTTTAHIPNYANTTTYKTAQGRSVGNEYAISYVSMWRGTTGSATQAINSITFLTDTTDNTMFAAGTKIDLYAMSPAAADTAQAFGGTEIYYDSTYVYHVFKGSGTFIPYRNLTVDALVIAGGGGGSGSQDGYHGRQSGGGAGGYRVLSSQAFTSGTSYAVTVGAGGFGSVNYTVSPGKGENSSIIGTGLSYSSTGGGFAGTDSLAPGPGGSGGGRTGGSGIAGVGGAGNQGGYSPVEGYKGGDSTSAGQQSGGGGAGGEGQPAVSGNTMGGNGGIGTFTTWVNSVASMAGLGVLSGGNYYFAGGGGGGVWNSGSPAGTGGLGGGGAGGVTNTRGASGMTNTGGGGGGGGVAGGGTNINAFGGNGGSGLVIMRYSR